VVAFIYNQRRSEVDARARKIFDKRGGRVESLTLCAHRCSPTSKNLRFTFAFVSTEDMPAEEHYGYDGIVRRTAFCGAWSGSKEGGVVSLEANI